MQIETSKIRNGAHIGDIVWICHYNRPDLNKKPLRNVPPTRVIVRANDELPKNKIIYYSETHFSPLNRDGKPLKKIISPVDNTGYRRIAGNGLFVFTTENECNKSWNKQIDECCKRIDVEIENASDFWRSDKSKLMNYKKQSLLPL